MTDRIPTSAEALRWCLATSYTCDWQVTFAQLRDAATAYAKAGGECRGCWRRVSDAALRLWAVVGDWHIFAMQSCALGPCEAALELAALEYAEAVHTQAPGAKGAAAVLGCAALKFGEAAVH